MLMRFATLLAAKDGEGFLSVQLESVHQQTASLIDIFRSR